MFRFVLLPAVGVALFLFVSCSENSLEPEFSRIQKNVLTGKADAVFAVVDKASNDYFEALITHVKNQDEEAATLLGNTNNIPISTMMIYDIMETYTSDSTGIQIKDQEYKEVLKRSVSLLGFGPFWQNKERPIRFREMGPMNDKRAEVVVAVPTGNGALLGTTYEFNKEEDVWMLNFISTPKLKEKILNQNYRNSGMPHAMFARAQNRKVNQDLQFRYAY